MKKRVTANKASKTKDAVMERMKRVLLLLLAFTVLLMLPEASATKFTVGNNQFWNPNINYTEWAKGKHFYLDFSSSFSFFSLISLKSCYLSLLLSCFNLNLNFNGTGRTG